MGQRNQLCFNVLGREHFSLCLCLCLSQRIKHRGGYEANDVKDMLRVRKEDGAREPNDDKKKSRPEITGRKGEAKQASKEKRVYF